MANAADAERERWTTMRARIEAATDQSLRDLGEEIKRKAQTTEPLVPVWDWSEHIHYVHPPREYLPAAHRAAARQIAAALDVPERLVIIDNPPSPARRPWWRAHVRRLTLRWWRSRP